VTEYLIKQSPVSFPSLENLKLKKIKYRTISAWTMQHKIENISISISSKYIYFFCSLKRTRLEQFSP